MNTFALGRDVEMLAARDLRRMGYVVHLAGHAAEADAEGKRIPYGRDLYGLFDALAVGNNDTRLVQVKATTGAQPEPKWRRAVERLPQPPGLRYEWWSLAGDGPLWQCWWLVSNDLWTSCSLRCFK